jgi:hypothetical protein
MGLAVDLHVNNAPLGFANPLPTGVTTVVAENGVGLPLDNLAQSFTYDGSGNLSTVTVVYNGVTYRQTFTYTAGRLTQASSWGVVP